MKLHITKSVGNDEYLCPNCGARVKYSPQRKKLAIHNLPLTPGKRCPTAKLEAELNLDPEGPMPELLKLEERPLVKEEPIKSKRQRRGRFRGPRDPLNPSRRWRDEYAIKGEDSWGTDDLGPEGGEVSVRARSGGRVESRRSRY